MDYFASFWCLILPVTENHQLDWDSSRPWGPMTPEIHWLLVLHRCLFLCLQWFGLPFHSSPMKDSIFFCVCHVAIDRIFNLWYFLFFLFFFSFKPKVLLCTGNCIAGNVVSLVGSWIFLSLEQWLGIEAVPQISCLLGQICCLASPCPARCSLLCSFSYLCWV